MNEILGEADNIRTILGRSKFFLDYYQREYRWEKTQINELLDDLSGKFMKDHKEGNERGAIQNYDCYFLGSIIISDKKGEQYIIDGQQRLTSLILLLICIYHKLNEQGQAPSYLSELIYFEQYGKYTYKLDVLGREKCMDSLRTGKPFNGEGESESIKNILARYNDIKELFPDELEGEALPYFTDWLAERVYLVQIKTSSDSDSDADAYTIFETMNDRGLSLTPTEMLKGHLLSRITDNETREGADKYWKEQIASLQNIGKGEDANAIKAWLRSQYAETRSSTPPGDFEQIGTEFHRWLSRNEQNIGLLKSFDFARFIREDFCFYGKWYEFIRKAASARKNNVEAIHYNAHNNFTLQYPVLLAPLDKSDIDDIVLRKLQIVSSFLDIWIARRIWNYKSTTHSSIRDDIFSVITKIRQEPIDRLTEILIYRLDKMQETFESNKTFGLKDTNKSRSQVRYLLARMTDYVWTKSSGDASLYNTYINHNHHEVEHIWARKKYKEHGYNDEPEYLEHRNRIGGLLLLRKVKNRSLKDKPYKDENASLKDEPDDKLSVYVRQSDNPLAYSLGKAAYKKGTGHSDFQKFIERSELEFRHLDEFGKDELNERQELYRELCKQIWNPEILKKPLKNM